ncbi:MAG: efflux RND transporter periplasmic adaptor subunit [Acidobacteriia bacterium]|nr:efflux RND transporter periplasmic adaptor subunit [Terriglobia bacterium]
MRTSRLVLVVVLVGVILGAYWLIHRGYIQIGKPPKGTNPSSALAQGHEGASAEANPSLSQRKILYWVDPMHPAYKSDKPGTAPDCGMELVPVYAKGENEMTSETLPSDAIHIDPQKQQLIGVQLGQVESGPVGSSIRAVGRLAYDETKITRIHTKVTGWIDKVFADYTGQLVKKGQPLFTLYSPDLLSTQEEFLIGLKAKRYLGDSQFKEVSTGAHSLYEASKQRLRLWDVSEDQIQNLERTGKPSRDLTLFAPSDGFVLKRNAFPQQQVTPDTEVYELADLSTIWVLADVYEYELPQIKVGETARVSLNSFPGRVFTGKISFIYPEIDNTTRTAKVRIDLPNPDYTLKPDMYADVELQISYGRQITIPQEAVLDSGNRQTVFVARGNGYFEPRTVELSSKVGGRVIVLSGLKPGETIVTSGNFLIDSESQLKSGTESMAGMPGMEGSKASDTTHQTSDQKHETQDQRPKTQGRGQTQPKEPDQKSKNPHAGMDHFPHGKMESPHLP